MSTPGGPDLIRLMALHAIRDSLPGTGRKTQQLRLLAALQRLGSVTTFEGSRHLDLYDVRARKMELVRAGYPVLMAWEVIQTESGELHRVGRYFLARDAAQGVQA